MDATDDVTATGAADARVVVAGAAEALVAAATGVVVAALPLVCVVGEVLSVAAPLLHALSSNPVPARAMTANMRERWEAGIGEIMHGG